jgi:hypothetical protein
MGENVFQQHKSVHLKGLVSSEVCKFMTHLLMVKAAHGVGGDPQVPNAFAVAHGEMACETLLETMWPVFEQVIGEELIPTYSYTRLYVNGNELEKHTDRPSCEVSATIQLGRSHHYSWPIYMGDRRYDMGEGDGVLYSGCDVEHWRNKCDGPPGYYSGQVFLHYVRANGPYAEHAGDKRWNDKHPFVRNRVSKMFNK